MYLILTIYFVEPTVSKKNNFSLFSLIRHIHIYNISNALISPFY